MSLVYSFQYLLFMITANTTVATSE